MERTHLYIFLLGMVLLTAWIPFALKLRLEAMHEWCEEYHAR